MKKTLKVLSVILVVMQLMTFVSFAAEEKSPFTDVKTSRWSYENIMFCYNNGLMNGVGDGKFNPTGKTTRAMITTILYRFAVSNGYTEEVRALYSFSDVDKKSWYGPAVYWAKANDVVNGVGTGTFAPNDPVTREQMAAMIVRMENYCGFLTDDRGDISSYPDVKKVHSYALDALSWANVNGIITGTSSGGTAVLDPRGYATREQVAAILNRFCEMAHKKYESPKLISTYTAPDYSSVPDADVYVSGSGDDGNSGTKDSPFRTINRAEEAVRGMLAGGTSGEIVVAIEGGTYHESLVFGTADSGNENVSVRYVGYNGTVSIGEGIVLPASSYEELSAEEKTHFFAENVSHIKKIDLSGYAASLPSDISVFNGNEALVIARYPNVGERGEDMFMRNVRNPNWYEAMEASIKYDRSAYGYVNEHAITLGTGVIDRAQKYHEVKGIRVKSYFAYDWASNDSYAEYDKATNVLTLDPAGFSGGYEINDVCNGRYYIYNVSEELDKSNEYYYGSTTSSLYIYDPSENGCSIAAGGNAITLNGARYLTLENLTVENVAGSGLVKNGAVDHISILNCTFKNIREHGIDLSAQTDYRRSHKVYKDPANDITIRGCEVFNIGGKGITVFGGERETLTPSNNVIDNNCVHDFAQRYTTYNAGITVDGVGIKVTHNELYNSPHYALFYEDGNDILIEKNYIHNVVKNTGDMGAIYSGRRWSNYGVTIRYNVIADVGFSEENRCGNGVYLDDELAGQEVYGNIFYNVSGSSFLSSGRDNTFRGNVIIHTRDCTGYDLYAYDKISHDCIKVWDGITDEFVEYAKNSTLTGEALFLDFCANPETERGNMENLWGSLREFDFRNGIWAEKFPALAGVSLNADDIDSGNFICNTGNVTIRDNFEIGSREFNISKNVEKFGGTAENNQVLSYNTAVYFKDAANGDYTLLPGNVISDVTDIPFAEIGRY